MGATNYRLFNSDHDADILCDLSVDVGLDKLQAAAEAAASEDGSAPKDVWYNLYCPSDEEVVRGFLETPSPETGITPLDVLLAKRRAIAFGPGSKDDYPDPGYIFVLLGASAMTLGCKLSAETLEDMRVIFTKSGFMPDALRELDAALNGPRAYNGTPYDFNALGFDEIASRPRSVSASGFTLLNVASPGGFYPPPPGTLQLVARIQARMAAYKLEKDDRDICGAGACNATKSKSKSDGDLLVCSKCRERKYCSKECQTAHWKSHKLVCTRV